MVISWVQLFMRVSGLSTILYLSTPTPSSKHLLRLIASFLWSAALTLSNYVKKRWKKPSLLDFYAAHTLYLQRLSLIFFVFIILPVLVSVSCVCRTRKVEEKNLKNTISILYHVLKGFLCIVLVIIFSIVISQWKTIILIPEDILF